MTCYNSGQPGCEGGVRRTVAGRACCWPCGARLLAAAREGLSVRDYGDEQPETAPKQARAEALGHLLASGGVKVTPGMTGTPDVLTFQAALTERDVAKVCEMRARLASQAETIDRLVAEKNAMEQDRAAALLSAVALEGKVARLVEERDGLTRVYRDLADRLARVEGLTTADARREVAGAVREGAEDTRAGAALRRVLAVVGTDEVLEVYGLFGGEYGAEAGEAGEYGRTLAEALERLAAAVEGEQ
jgi:hypothetical protein